jgi:hypothetical protein
MLPALAKALSGIVNEVTLEPPTSAAFCTIAPLPFVPDVLKPDAISATVHAAPVHVLVCVNVTVPVTVLAGRKRHNVIRRVLLDPKGVLAICVHVPVPPGVGMSGVAPVRFVSKPNKYSRPAVYVWDATV